MLLPREFISYLSRQLVRRLTPGVIETPDPAAATEFFTAQITNELAAEDKLNDEVRQILDQYSEYMRKEGVSYAEMFRRIKNQLIKERKIVRASGRDTGDAMKLSRDKINDVSHKLVAAMKTSRIFRLKKDINDVRLQLVAAFTEILTVEDKADHAARIKVRTQKRDIPEGAEEWDILHRRYYAEELKKVGIDLGK